ncbi:Dicarboxylic amino acid permease [Grifola frondosa]|uniref:Dicarboxylic amino acid permease n=1 Tax=Grifola frondosa TaxID=5627 RepID=A0A1C7M0R3_GRIFR|nr:Dicarboxylic amino acid permease [Grifola frondosa]
MQLVALTMARLMEKDVSLEVKAVDDSNSEANVPSEFGERTLLRQMKNRHIAMISIGGTLIPLLSFPCAVADTSCQGVIGTGLFLGTASGLRNGGPVGLLLGYCVVGSVCYTVMISLGEMAAFLPIPGGHITFAERFVDSAWSFAVGWLYCYNWIIILPAEVSAGAVLINYWNRSINNAVWISLCLAIVISINLFGASVYGEAEFIFASVKVITITGLIILGIVLDLGGGPNHDRIGFRYWKHPGPFAQFNEIEGAKGRFLAWWAVMTQAAFSFIGTEVVAIAGAEVKNPRRSIPKAIRRVYVRLLLFYIGGVAIIGLLVPFTDPRLNLTDGTAAASPFVIAIQNAGIKALPSIINACLLISAWSAANSDLYCSSRALYGLAANGNAPSIFLKVTKHGLPWVSVMICASFGLLSYMDLGSGSGRVFGWTAISGLVSWFGIAVIYIRFHKGLKVQGIDRKTLPYMSMLQPYAAWYAAIMCFILCFFSGWSVFLKGQWATDVFVTNYLPLMLFPVLYIGARLWMRTSFVKPEEMDFKSGLAEVLSASYDEPPPRNFVERSGAGWLDELH